MKLERRVESGVVELELEHRGRKVVVAFGDDRKSVHLRNFDKP